MVASLRVGWLAVGQMDGRRDAPDRQWLIAAVVEQRESSSLRLCSKSRSWMQQQQQQQQHQQQRRRERKVHWTVGETER